MLNSLVRKCVCSLAERPENAEKWESCVGKRVSLMATGTALGEGVPQGGGVYDSQHVGGAPASPDMSGPVVVTHVGARGHAGSVPVRLMDMM